MNSVLSLTERRLFIAFFVVINPGAAFFISHGFIEYPNLFLYKIKYENYYDK